MRPKIDAFEQLVRSYLAGRARWNQVHQFAIDMEWTSSLDFPGGLNSPLEALHTAFLTADESDDPQFRADDSEIARLVEEIDRTRGSSHGG